MELRDKTKCKNLIGSQKIARKMVVVVLVLAVSLICCSITVYAWFQATLVNSNNVIKATNYHLDISVTDISENPVNPNGSGSYLLVNGQTYNVTLTAKDNSVTGYCIVQIGDKQYYTTQIEKDQILSFSIRPTGDQTCTFTATWGKYSGTPDIAENTVITSESTPANAGILQTPNSPQNSSAMPSEESQSTENGLGQSESSSSEEINSNLPEESSVPEIASSQATSQ